ncbi:hypothetical protein CTI12_AA406410 [Artemisia annua]|uniref:Uncharacterized protein n=1 Tax=Artemisia annua TaxID=35608 RepID=A0A2U1M6T5_ARTAN|nr:hypothetical protein CTI12_AA406410 [Artemisia annua]
MQETCNDVESARTLWYFNFVRKPSPNGRCLDIIKGEGLVISQQALDPNSTGIYHRNTVWRTNKFHGRDDSRCSGKCSDAISGQDTARKVGGYSEIIVMRYFESGVARRAVMTTNISDINVVDGPTSSQVFQFSLCTYKG